MPYTTIIIQNDPNIKYQQTHDGEIDVPALVIALNRGDFRPKLVSGTFQEGARLRQEATMKQESICPKEVVWPGQAKTDPYSL